MSRIELSAVAKRWGEVTAVEPTDLRIGDGEFVAILGPSGCGKSTTLFMLAGIYTPSARAASCSTARRSTKSRRVTAMSASSSSPTRSTRT